MVAPTLLEICAEVNGHLNIEYPIAVNEWLKGNLDYYIAADQNLLVVEAKQSDLGKGLTQLAVELIALDLNFRGGRLSATLATALLDLIP